MYDTKNTQIASPMNGDDNTDATRRLYLKTALAGAALATPWVTAKAQSIQAPHKENSINRTPLPQEPHMFAYVGSRTSRERNARGDGITVFKVDRETGKLSTVQVVSDLVNPSYLSLDRTGTHLYAIHGDLDYVSSFNVDRSTGKLQFLNRQSTQGNNPVHLAINPTGHHLIVSNHLSGSLAVLPIANDGSLEPLTQLVKLEGQIGPHRVEQTQSKPHFNGFDPSGQFVIVPDKGLDRVFSFRFKDGQLSPTEKPFAITREEAGPRHHIFHPHLQMTYVVNELDSTVTAYQFDPRDGALIPHQRLSTLPEDFTEDSRASGIMMAPDGRTLYASNRGHDSIGVFTIDTQTGWMRFVGATKTQGAKPRFFTLNPSGTVLYALNEDSDTIAAFSIAKETGRLSPMGAHTPCGSPVCMIFS